MKFKYKKIILLVTMSSMGIGMITLSLSNSQGKESNNKKQKINISSEQQNNSEDKANATGDGLLKIGEGLVDDGTLQENAYPQINQLIEKYLAARAVCDMDTIKELVSSTNTISLEILQKESENIESYNNIACYTIKAPDEKSFVVYVYEELKIVEIDTLAPGMIRLYVNINSEGKPIIYFGQVDDKTSDFIDATGNDVKVIQLIDSVNKKLEEATTSDENLRNFINGLETSSKNIAKDTSKNISKDTTKDTSKETTKDTTKDTSKDTSKDKVNE